MHKPHYHNATCKGPPECKRVWEIDERSITGSYYIVTRKNYGKRTRHDKPKWWPFAFHAFKAIVQLLGIVVLAWIAKKTGLVLSP